MKRILVFLFAALTALAASAQINTATLLSAATGTGAGTARQGPPAPKTYQAFGTTSSGAGSATITVQCSNNSTNWDTVGTIALTLATTTSSNSFFSMDRCAFLRGNVTAISGTGASVNLIMGF